MQEGSATWDNLCRICLVKNEDDNEFESVFNCGYTTEDLPSLGDIYEEIFQLPALTDYSHPGYFCKRCGLQMRFFHKFKTKAVEAYQKFMGIKVEGEILYEDSEPYQTNTFAEKYNEYCNNHYSNKIIKQEYECSPIDRNLNTSDVNVKDDSGDDNENNWQLIHDISVNENIKPINENSNLSEPNDKYLLEYESSSPIKHDFKINDTDEQRDSDINIFDETYNDVMKKETSEDSEEFWCVVCNRKFSKITHLRMHSKIHDNNEDCLKFECSICHEKYRTKRLLTSHIGAMHSTNYSKEDSLAVESSKRKLNIPDHNGFECNKCNIIFLTRKNLELHRKDKHARTYYNCTLCSKKCFSKETFDVHMNLHYGLPAYRCNECQKEFKSKFLYENHMMAHRNEIRIQCHLCGKGFVNNGNFRIHLRVHNDERRYSCDVCGKKFRAHSHMKNHRYTHSKKQFQCSICPQKFAVVSTLRLHVKTVHENRRDYECHTCNMRFKRSHHLKVHRERHKSVAKDAIVIEKQNMHSSL